MKSNRLFYIGLGCLFSTLCWTIVMVAKDNRNLSTLQVDHLICNDIRVLDRDGRLVARPTSPLKSCRLGWLVIFTL